MKFMEDWEPFTDMRTVFSYHDVLNLRILYANMLYFFSQNEFSIFLFVQCQLFVFFCLDDHLCSFLFVGSVFKIFFSLISFSFLLCIRVDMFRSINQTGKNAVRMRSRVAA